MLPKILNYNAPVRGQNKAYYSLNFTSFRYIFPQLSQIVIGRFQNI